MMPYSQIKIKGKLDNKVNYLETIRFTRISNNYNSNKEYLSNYQQDVKKYWAFSQAKNFWKIS